MNKYYTCECECIGCGSPLTLSVEWGKRPPVLAQGNVALSNEEFPPVNCDRCGCTDFEQVSLSYHDGKKVVWLSKRGSKYEGFMDKFVPQVEDYLTEIASRHGMGNTRASLGWKHVDQIKAFFLMGWHPRKTANLIAKEFWWYELG